MYGRDRKMYELYLIIISKNMSLINRSVSNDNKNNLPSVNTLLPEEIK